MRISDAQSRAIAHGTGPAMVLAGPGSGKTLVITNRTKYLIEQYHVPPEHILVITFTRAAAREMQERFHKISNARGVTFGTFHAVFFWILKYAYHFTSANILTEEKKYQILGQLLREMRLSPQDEKEMLSDLAGEISLVKNERINLEHYYAKCCPEEVFREIYRKYEKLRNEIRMVDFDDILVCTYELLKERADILSGWQNRFQYILVDEFQDINGLQYEILRLLASPGNNLFIVGDDDQSIYRFRGAKPEIMMNFPKDYPDTEKIILNHNFRSVAPVVKNALQVIGNNKNRFKKEIQTVRSGGRDVDIQEFESQEHESLYLVKSIQKSLEAGLPLSEIAVLFRTNLGAGPYAERLMEFNIPFVMRDALPDIYDHWVAKDIFAYLHLALNQLDRALFLQVMNRPKRYISRDSVDTKIISFDNLRDYYEEKYWMQERLDEMENDLKLLQKMTPYAAVNFIRHGIHYEDYVTEFAKEHRMKPEELTDLLDEIQQSAKPYRTYEDWFAHLEAYRERLKEKHNRKKEKEDGVQFATLHSAKGLEFTEVYLVDVNDGVIPHQKAVLEADLEEERRLLYVGMTRAKDSLHLFYTKERYGKAADPSPFIRDILDLS